MFQDASQFNTSFPCCLTRMWGVFYAFATGFTTIPKRSWLQGCWQALPHGHWKCQTPKPKQLQLTPNMHMRFHGCPRVGCDLMRSCPLQVRAQWPLDALSVEWPRPETPLRLSVWRSGIHVDRFIVDVCDIPCGDISREGKISIYFRRMH